jgi:large subunit ribosomal protein L24
LEKVFTKEITSPELFCRKTDKKAKKHQRPTKSGSKGQVVEKVMPISVSNVMLMENGKKVRAGKKVVAGKKIRISKKTGKEI